MAIRFSVRLLVILASLLGEVAGMTGSRIFFGFV